jgi:protein-L-isoaspartate O-methyltransferase
VITRNDPHIPEGRAAPPKAHGLLRYGAGLLARTPLFWHSKALWQQNLGNRSLQLSKWAKISVGSYLILKDYSEGNFPPKFGQQQCHSQEINYRSLAPGATPEEVGLAEMVKPFWFGPHLRGYFENFIKLTDAFAAAGITPPAKILELGGGAGWAAEFLSQLGFRVISTTISPDDVTSGWKRVEALRIKGLPGEMTFIATPMESVASQVKAHCPVDAVFVFAALHHAFDWKAAITSAFSCIAPGGWLLICQEPNVLHVATSYRVARLTQTHEIGFAKGQLVKHLRQTGFRRVVSRGKRLHFFWYPHWLLAQK